MAILETIRTTGDVVEAEKAFDGIGRDTVTSLLHAWPEGWR